MDIATAAQVASSVSNVLLILVFGFGYYKQYQVSQRTLRELHEDRIAEGRPQVLIYADYSRIPEVDLVISNTGGGPAKSLEFTFSQPITAPDGFVISQMRYLAEGMESLAPASDIARNWGNLEEIIDLMKRQDLTQGITVYIAYKDLTGRSYLSQWNVNPTLYEGNRDVTSRDMVALVDTMEGVSDTLDRISTNLEGVGDRFGRLDGKRGEHSDDPPKGSGRERSGGETSEEKSAEGDSADAPPIQPRGANNGEQRAPGAG